MFITGTSKQKLACRTLVLSSEGLLTMTMRTKQRNQVFAGWNSI